MLRINWGLRGSVYQISLCGIEIGKHIVHIWFIYVIMWLNNVSSIDSWELVEMRICLSSIWNRLVCYQVLLTVYTINKE